MSGLAYDIESNHSSYGASVSKKNDKNKVLNRMEVGRFESLVDQTPLRYCFSPPQNEDSLCVVVVNGRGEFFEKYLDLVEDLNLPEDTGFLSWDHRGQGLSGGNRAWVETFDHYSLDAQSLIQNLIGNHPYVIVSHSMGGLIALQGILHKRLFPQKIVLSAPFLGLPMKPWPPLIAKSLCKMFNHLGLGKLSLSSSTELPSFEKNILTHCANRYQRILDFKGRVGEPTFGWVAAASKALSEVHTDDMFVALKQVDVFMLQAGCEQIVNPKEADLWAERGQKRGVSLECREIPGAFHELLAESPELYGEVIKSLREWLHLKE